MAGPVSQHEAQPTTNSNTNTNDVQDPAPIYPSYYHPLHLRTHLRAPVPPPWEPTLTEPTPRPTPTAHIIHFPSTPLSTSYTSHLAFLIDNFLTPSECASLIALAESTGPWIPADVNGAVLKGYRDSERILVKDEVAGAWIYQRLEPWLEELGVEVIYEPREDGKVGDEMGRVGGERRFAQVVPREVRLVERKGVAVKGKGRGSKGGKATSKEEEQEEVVRWEMGRLNPLLRFLKYGPGQFFQRHCDQHFTTSCLPDWDSSQPLEKSWITIQLYLSSPGLAGGATSFWGRGKDYNTKIDVEARQGRVLVFQQRELIHTGEKVEGGEKVTVRSEVMYKKVVEKVGKK